MARRVRLQFRPMRVVNNAVNNAVNNVVNN